MSKLEAKLLGEEKVETYCSSSEDEEPPEQDRSNSLVSPWKGVSKNTGPKGVLQDWNIFRQHEKKLLDEKKDELVAICKATTLTCLTEREVKDMESSISVEDEDELLSDDTLKDFMKARMEQMMRKHTELPEFGEVEDMPSGEDYLKLIDGTNPMVPVIVHIFEARVPECIRMNECLSSLSSMYRHVKFCKIKATNLGVSSNFKKQGVPALLVYKGGSLIGNFVGLKEEFGSEFYVGDVENYLIENGVLEDKSNVPTLWTDKRCVKSAK